MNSHNDANFSPRQAYRKPELHVYGSINQLTKNNLNDGNQDNASADPGNRTSTAD